jgi:hypothetical protein
MNASHCIVPPSLGRAPAPAAFRHAGGMKAISRRLSAATPPEPHANQNASQRDASMHWERCRTRGPLAGIPSGCDSFRWRILRWCRCAQPPANRCDASGIRSVAFNDPVTQWLSQTPSLRGSFHRVFFTPQKYGVLLTHRKQRRTIFSLLHSRWLAEVKKDRNTP